HLRVIFSHFYQHTATIEIYTLSLHDALPIYMGEMVEDDYYQKTISYQDDIDAANRVNELKQKPELIFQANGILLKFYEQPESGTIHFLRSNNSEEDVIHPLKLNSRNEQLIHALELVDGDYEVSIRWKQNGEDYLFKKSIHWKSPSS